MSYSLQETDTRKIRYQIACQARQKPVPVFDAEFADLSVLWALSGVVFARSE